MVHPAEPIQGKHMTSIAVVGGGPGGLVTTYYLNEELSKAHSVTLFEASPRLGGKISTRRFAKTDAIYEAGVAEIYNYSSLGIDPLRDLIDELGLETVPMAGQGVVLGDVVLNALSDVQRVFGAETYKALSEFYDLSARQMSAEQYYRDDADVDNDHPWSKKSLRDVLDTIPDETARHYVETAIRSDVASEPHLTSALNGLKNIVMEDPRYMTVYSIVGGIERLVDRLSDTIEAQVRLSSSVVGAVQLPDGHWTLSVRKSGKVTQQTFDKVIFALPNYWLSAIRWGSRPLRQAMQRHLAYYDRPAHYLRVTALFEKPFWRGHIEGSYWMHDAFGGCCVYDETARHPHGDYGVLSWLISGVDAVALSNLHDKTLIARALDALPEPLAFGRGMFLEARVHRWLGAVNALPGGSPVLELERRHRPDAAQFPGLFVVGDYLFDSTINGVVDSAEFVTDRLRELLEPEQTAQIEPKLLHEGVR